MSENREKTDVKIEESNEKEESCCPRRGKRRKVFFGIVAAIATLGITASVLAFGGRMMFRRHRIMARVVSKLDLTSQQKARLRIIWKEATRDRKQNHARMKALRDKMFALLQQDKPNKKEMDLLVVQTADAAKKIALSKTSYILRAHAVLTPKQRARLAKMAKKFKKRMEKFRKCRGHHKKGWVPPFLR